jgi:hypothetical protein
MRLCLPLHQTLMCPRCQACRTASGGPAVVITVQTLCLHVESSWPFPDSKALPECTGNFPWCQPQDRPSGVEAYVLGENARVQQAKAELELRLRRGTEAPALFTTRLRRIRNWQQAALDCDASALDMSGNEEARCKGMAFIYRDAVLKQSLQLADDDRLLDPLLRDDYAAFDEAQPELGEEGAM